MTDRRLEYLALDDIQPAPRNPKGHDLADLKSSVERFGYVEPIVLDERTGRLVAGHGRVEYLLAAQEMDEKAPEGLQTDKKGRWLVPVLRGWASRSDAEAEAFLVASNRITEKGGWDTDILAELIAELAEGPGLEGTGFSPEELADLIAQLNPPSLEDLHDEHGDPNDEALWPVLRFKVPPPLRDRYLELVDQSADDHVQFGDLVALAESGALVRDAG